MSIVGRLSGSLLLCGVLTLAGGASATTMTTVVTDFGGALEVRVTLDDAGADPGEILVTVEVLTGEADIRGIFMDIADDSLLAGMSVAGVDVTDFDFSGSVIDLGQGANVQGGGSPCPCDFGVEIGTPGIGSNDVQLTSFVLSHTSQPLTLALFDGQALAVRLTSVGDEFSRENSSKSFGTFVPEPAPASLWLAGLGLLALRRRSLRAG